MNRGLTVLLIVCAAALYPSCKPAEEAAQPALPATREDVFREGHQLFLLRQRDSAEVRLRQVVAMDSTYRPALQDLAELWYERAWELRAEETRAHDVAMRTAFRYFARLETLGQGEA
jgi:hypothetical protein